MDIKSVGFIGGGRITKIFLHGFKNTDIQFKNIIVFDPNKDNLHKLKNKFPDIKIEDSVIDEAAKCDVIFIAVHPPIVMETLSKIEPFVSTNTMIVSLAPKITIEKLKTALPVIQAIARVNPSAGGIINQGINPVAFCEGIDENQKNYLLSLLSILGSAPMVEERKIEAYAVISAMGSTYFWFQLQKLKELGIQFGMNEDEAQEVITEMLKGTINTLFFSEIPNDEVMDLVPVKPLGEFEEIIKSYYTDKLNGIFEKIKP